MAAPGRKRLNRARRLNVAKEWVAAYPGGNLIRGYTKWFGVSEVCAVVELRMLGVEIPESRLEQAKRSEKARAARRAERKQDPGRDDADETFAFVAGYTPGGAPYGVEQDVADAAWDPHRAWHRVLDDMVEDEELPF
jgi:hypothetical protein